MSSRTTPYTNVNDHDRDGNDDDDDESSVSSSDLSCSLTMPPVVTEYELKRYKNGALTIQEEEDDDDEDDDDSSTSETSHSNAKKGEPLVEEVEKQVNGNDEVTHTTSTKTKHVTEKDETVTIEDVQMKNSEEKAAPGAVDHAKATSTSLSDPSKLLEGSTVRTDATKDMNKEDADDDDDDSSSSSDSMAMILSPPRNKYIDSSPTKKRDAFGGSLSGIPEIPTSPTSQKETIKKLSTTTTGLSHSISSLPIMDDALQYMAGHSSLSSLPVATSNVSISKTTASGKKTRRASSATTPKSPKSKSKSKKKSNNNNKDLSSSPSQPSKKRSSAKASSKSTKSDSKTATKNKAIAKTVAEADTTVTAAESNSKPSLSSSAVLGRKYQDQQQQQQHHLAGNAQAGAFLDRLLSTCSLHKFGIDLPTIAVMGDTSSGKSSVLSQLACIELPKAQSFTTKCPIRLHMKRCQTLDQKCAVIAVEWRSHIVSNQYPEFPPVSVKYTAHQETGCWDTEVANAIAEAQQFVLHHTTKDVTNDIVCVKIQAPDCLTELTIVDLPGAMRSKTGIDESETLRSEIAELQQEYLSMERCIIVAIHSATVDWHNAQITADAAVVDPNTERTVAVLTKPDLIDLGAEQDVVDLLSGKNLHFKLGIHMVKCRGQAALDANVSLRQGIFDEAKYFESIEPWNSLQNTSLLGTANLRQKLGELQTNMIKRTLPRIIQEIREKKLVAEATLQEMGEIHTGVQDKRRYYQNICQAIVSLVKASLSGKSGGNKSFGAAPANNTKPSAATCLHDDCSQFRDRIQDGRLATIRTIREGGNVLVISRRGTVRGEVVHLDDKFACVDYIDDEDKSSEALFESVCLRAPEPIEENDVWSAGNKICIARKDNIYDCLRKIPLESVRTDPTWLKEKIAGNRTDDLACFLNVDSFKSIVEEFIEVDWKPHAMRLLDLTRETLNTAMDDAIKATLATDRYPPLRSLVTQQCRKASQEVLKQAHKQILSHFEIEKHPYTQDKELFECIAAGRHRTLRRELEVALKVDNESVLDTQTIKALMVSVFERNRLKSVEDQMAEEMEIVLDAYGSVATRRVIDRTPMICWEVFRSLSNALQDSLWKVPDDALHRLMQEDPTFVSKYNAATEELKEMTKALQAFESMV